MESKVITNKAPARFTCLAFSRDGVRAFTGGDDCIVRIWKVESEQDPATAAEAERGITSIATSDDCWLSASLDADVRRYVENTTKMDGIVTNTKGVPARCVAVDPRGKTVAVASDELEIRLIDMDDPANIKLLKAHRGGVRKVTWHPTEPILTSCGSDGQIIVWDVSKDPPTQEADIQGFIPTIKNSDAEEYLHDCSAVWHPSGEYFFVASRARDIVTIQRSNWKKDKTYFDQQTQGPVTGLAVSPNGAYLASASQGMVHVWSIETKKVIASRPSIDNKSNKNTPIVTQLAFSPSENLIAWTTNDGTFSRWLKPISLTHPDPVEPLPGLKPSNQDVADVKPVSIIGDDDDDMFGTNIDGIEVIPDNISEASQDWIDEDQDKGDLDTGGHIVKEMVSITKAQPPFQPGATPMLQTKRFLAINALGFIEITAVPNTDRTLVDVKFFDESKMNIPPFADEFGYDLGYLGERGALFASKPRADHDARVHYKPYADNNPPLDWTYMLRPTCKVLGIAAGGLPSSDSKRQIYDGDLDGFGNIVVATTDGDLTFLSGTGRERRVMGLGGDFLSMVAGHEWVFVVHRVGSTTIDGSQNLSYSLINFDDFSVRQRDFLPIPKGHLLKWIGITEEGAPAMYDTTGRIHILTKYRIPHHASWARMMDTNHLERKKGKDESYWPISIFGSTLLCFILKGTERYPKHPLPLPQELPIEMPFRTENKAEEKVERDTVLLEILRDGLDDQLINEEISKTEQLMDKELVLLIQQACKINNIPRAVELAKLIHNSRFLDSVVKIAQFYRFDGMMEKIQALKSIREDSEDRLILAREKRKQWTRPDPLPRPLSIVDDSASSRPKPFQDFGPPPVTSRPGLAPAIPTKETTRYTSATFLPSTPSGYVSEDSLSENKRKRDELDDVSSSLDFVAPPPKQKTNPFARKSGQDTNKNPFARKSDVSRTIQKSESFFEKVDAVDDIVKSKRSKTKDKKEGPRQTTLFGMMASARIEKKSQVAESQDSDVAMSDRTLGESGTQPDLPEEWEETQPIDGTSVEETQPVTEQ
ncbi:hypothetical protein GGX14DRAFT_495522 [Mycena pura]|uniref:Minichromosome loss protein Mcl1 middle region domain-containing protein n=1 Tax=Mycena pura TaxID=153505 RepID=A0AAD6YG58_9AGAR|nr:hypothetical protein GGX14DRAFT_495522 [Mycena pura]